MGEAELHTQSQTLIIRSVFYFYGDAASKDLSIAIAEDIGSHWNEPAATVFIRKEPYSVRFEIEGIYAPDLPPAAVWHNTNPLFNYFRIEEYSAHDISFVDGLSCNTGYFKLANLADHSTTAAHEYGHTLGLDHPKILDIRGQGQPGIMYPRGTLCDPIYQYEPDVPAGLKGGTLNPYKRKVLTSDIANLRLDRLSFRRGRKPMVGDFSSRYHEKHVV